MNNDVPHIISQWFSYLRILFSILLPSFFRDLPSAPSHELEIPINQPFIPFHNPSLPSMQPGNGGRAGGAFRGLATLAGERWRKTAAISGNPVCISHFVQGATLVLKAQVCDGLCYGRGMTSIRLKDSTYIYIYIYTCFDTCNCISIYIYIYIYYNICKYNTYRYRICMYMHCFLQ